MTRSPDPLRCRAERCCGCNAAPIPVADEASLCRFGYWILGPYQIPGWLEAGEVELVALYNRTRSKAEAVSGQFGGRVYDDVEALLDSEELDFVDIITDVDTHRAFAEQALRRGLDVVCQKPLAPSSDDAKQLVDFETRCLAFPNDETFCH